MGRAYQRRATPLFGERPHVDTDFEKEEYERYRGKRSEAAFFLDLD